jgi:hypothetical protein
VVAVGFPVGLAMSPLIWWWKSRTCRPVVSQSEPYTVRMIGGIERLTRAAVSEKNTEWSSTPCPSSASMFCSTAGRGPIRNMRLSPK